MAINCAFEIVREREEGVPLTVFKEMVQSGV